MSGIHSNLPLPMEIARRKFRARFRKLADNVEKMCWVLEHPLGTQDECDLARRWLRLHGWSEPQIEAAQKRRVTR